MVFQRNFKEMSRNKGNYKMFLAWFKEVSGCVKNILTVFQESFISVLQKGFMGFSSRFKGISGCFMILMILTLNLQQDQGQK